jgi:hypothetical protein
MPKTTVADRGSRVRGTLYHSPLRRAAGDELLPLNLLHDRHPEIYRQHRRRYDGREWVLDQRVPPLNCTWGDVVFFSPVDSTLIFEALHESGRTTGIPDSWTMDAGLLDPASTCIRLMRMSRTGPEAKPADADDFLPYTTGTLRAVSRVTHAALERLRQLGPDEPLLPWVDVPHVLHRGPVPLRHLRRPDGSATD